MRVLRKRIIEWSGRIFFVMKDAAGARYRLWELVSSEHKFSALLVEIKQPEREAILARLPIQK